MTMKPSLVVTGMAGVLLVAVVAPAQTVDRDVQRAIQEFRQGEWSRAAMLLRVAAPRLKEARARADAFKVLGLCEVELRRPAAAEVAFVEALTALPLLDLNPVEDPPEAVTVFRAVRDRLEGRLSISGDRRPARDPRTTPASDP